MPVIQSTRYGKKEEDRQTLGQTEVCSIKWHPIRYLESRGEVKSSWDMGAVK